MGNKHTLTIKDWSGTGTGSIDLEIGGFVLIERRIGSRTIQKLIVNRKPDKYSSRFGMMASLNKRNQTLSWGFSKMSLSVKTFSDRGVLVTRRVFNFFNGIAVADSRAISNSEEELTFVFNNKGEVCEGSC